MENKTNFKKIKYIKFGKNVNYRKGFTFTEILVTASLFFLLTSFVVVNLLNAKKQSALTSSLDLVILDIKRQQVKAMIGDTEGRNYSDNYGLSFATNNYTLFHGISFVATDSANLNLPLGDKIQFTNVTLPMSQIVFLKGSGEINNYATSSSEFSLQDSSTNQKITVKLNRYGVITSVN